MGILAGSLNFIYDNCGFLPQSTHTVLPCYGTIEKGYVQFAISPWVAVQVSATWTRNAVALLKIVVVWLPIRQNSLTRGSPSRPTNAKLQRCRVLCRLSGGA